MARRDVAWINSLNLNEYAAKRFPQVDNVTRTDTATRYLEAIALHEQQMWDAAVARVSRLILVGIVVPALVTLLAIANFEWFFPGRAPLIDIATGARFHPNINQALLFIATQEMSFLSEVLQILKLSTFPYEYDDTNFLLGALVYALKMLVSGYIFAVGVFAWKLPQFENANAATKATLKSVVDTSNTTIAAGSQIQMLEQVANLDRKAA